ncbi:MAG: hypothetical protein ACK4E0_05195 [Chitinophagaceae bacterium]
MTRRNLLKLIVGLLMLFAVAFAITAIRHPIILKWMEGSARHIGKPIPVKVYTNGQLNDGVKVFHIDKYWDGDRVANSYLLCLTGNGSLATLKFININLDESWIGKPVATSKKDYDFVAGHLFQSETGGHFTPFQDDMKGFDFDPQLSFTDRQIIFNMPQEELKFDSVRIELYQ